jgi:hypothetical protein
MYTLLETCLDKLDIFEFLTHVENGLKDHYDIKVRLKFVYNNDKKYVHAVGDVFRQTGYF